MFDDLLRKGLQLDEVPYLNFLVLWICFRRITSSNKHFYKTWFSSSLSLVPHFKQGIMFSYNIWHCNCVHEWFFFLWRPSQRRSYLNWWRRPKKMYLLLALEDWLSTMTTFDFWMLVDANDIFAFVKFHLCRLTTQKHNYTKVVWSNQDKWWSFKLCLPNMDWGKKICLHKKWRCKFGNNGCNLECYCELWKLGIGGTFPRHMFWP